MFRKLDPILVLFLMPMSAAAFALDWAATFHSRTDKSMPIVAGRSEPNQHHQKAFTTAQTGKVGRNAHYEVHNRSSVKDRNEESNRQQQCQSVQATAGGNKPFVN